MKIAAAILMTTVVFLILYCSHSNNVRKRIERDTVRREDLAKHRESGNALKTFYGIASYYGQEFHGRKTASGEIFDADGLTGAHRTLPFGTICRVTNLDNNQSVIIRINDRGPFVKDRILDLSRGAARQIDCLQTGTAKVKIDIISYPEK